MKRFYYFIAIWLLGFNSSFAQIDFGSLEEEQIYHPDRKYNTWSVSVGYGPVFYYVDVTDFTLFPKDNWKFGPSVTLAKQFGRSWAVQGEFLMADMYGQKPKYRYFEGDMFEGSLNVIAYLNQLILNGPMADKWNVYAKLGLGAVAFRSAHRSSGNEDYENGELLDAEYFLGFPSGYPTSYSGWDPDHYLVMGYNRENNNMEKTSRQTELIVPMAVGVKYRVNKSFDFGFETSLRNMMADNLDVDMSGADNDSYLYSSFSITYKIGKKNKRHASWTYKDFNLAYERQRERDPMVQRLDSLRNHLQYLSTRDSMVVDTTYINTEELYKFDTFSVSLFFDFDKAEILPAGHRSMASVAKYMKDNPEARMMVQGYTDERGSYEYNLRLSERRCKAVIDALISDFGIDATRFSSEPRGKAELLSDTRALAPRGLHLVNRRVDVFLLSE